jgi:hypothetical protein
MLREEQGFASITDEQYATFVRNGILMETQDFRAEQERYQPLNDQWHSLTRQSGELASQGRFEEAKQKWQEGEAIYNTIPERYRR